MEQNNLLRVWEKILSERSAEYKFDHRRLQFNTE
jgi:hypothetical protein